MLAKLLVFLPLFGFLGAAIASRLNSFEKKKVDLFAQIFTSTLLAISAILAIIIFCDIATNKEPYVINLFSWIYSGDLKIEWALKVDQLTAIMLIVVTFVSSLVHIYSIGYMHEDKSIARFMSYLSLFTFFMLALVTSDNFVQLFFGWEGVGLASYLLIGFWFKKESANNAAMKAFIANRVGDFGLIIAIALIYFSFGSLSFDVVFKAAPQFLDNKLHLFGIEVRNIDAICILLFVGAMGKSAQIGLHVWLADAMEGPTPVSALIHAATMVTAGVFLVARCSPLFEFSPIALAVVTLVGAVTAIFAGTIAITQNDIKRIIAYSTCSQLGYMFFACGVSVYSAAMFHLATHAFFKALLFLGAGSVIYAMHHEQDITKMGKNLYKKIPITYAMIWIGSLALAGFPPFAGFYSKDVILEAAFVSDALFGKTAFILGIVAAFLTAFYSWRLIFVAFHGSASAPLQHDHKHDHDHHHEAHESPNVMRIPLYLLAFGSVFAGILGYNILHMVSAENNFFASAIFVAEQNSQILEEIHHVPLYIKYMPLVIGVVAIALAYLFYVVNTNLPKQMAKIFKPFYKISFNKWYFDEFYNFALVQPTKKLGSLLSRIFDRKFIDGLGVNGVADLCKKASAGVSKLQTGFIYDYSLAMVFGVVVIGIFVINLVM